MIYVDSEFEIEGRVAPGIKPLTSSTTHKSQPTPIYSKYRKKQRPLQPRYQGSHLQDKEKNFLLKGTQYAQQLVPLIDHYYTKILTMPKDIRKRSSRTLHRSDRAQQILKLDKNNLQAKLPLIVNQTKNLSNIERWLLDLPGVDDKLSSDARITKEQPGRERQNCLTKYRKPEQETAAVSKGSRKLKDVLGYEFQQTPEHGTDIFYHSKYCQENKNCNNYRDYRKHRLIDIGYQFETLQHYNHLNNILPMNHNKSQLVMNGFPPHCIDTVLLRLMFEMSKLDMSFEN